MYGGGKPLLKFPSLNKLQDLCMTSTKVALDLHMTVKGEHINHYSLHCPHVTEQEYNPNKLSIHPLQSIIYVDEA